MTIRAWSRWWSLSASLTVFMEYLYINDMLINVMYVYPTKPVGHNFNYFIMTNSSTASSSCTVKRHELPKRLKTAKRPKRSTMRRTIAKRHTKYR